MESRVDGTLGWRIWNVVLNYLFLQSILIEFRIAKEFSIFTNYNWILKWKQVFSQNKERSEWVKFFCFNAMASHIHAKHKYSYNLFHKQNFRLIYLYWNLKACLLYSYESQSPFSRIKIFCLLHSWESRVAFFVVQCVHVMRSGTEKRDIILKTYT